ncbi:hypothetical protein PENANT_c029G08961 [Penicillium antarcticum]|uniref:Uncharacterized protein n=1 Tax=Penicillium antarcticum TaxID=416450 RepID=A0A1V6PW15_9EURO|nr:hypothetical protein PENANT_c029G08961 [Penicillium antarcticum]
MSLYSYNLNVSTSVNRICSDTCGEFLTRD